MPQFNYQSTPNPYSASVGELLLRKGDIAAHGADQVAQAQARAALLQGQARAQAVQSIGQDVSGQVQHALDEQKNAPIRALQQQALQQQVTEGDLQLKAAQRSMMGQTVLAEAVSKFGDDPQKVAAFVAKSGFPDVAAAYADSAVKQATTWRALKNGQIADADAASAFEADQLQRIVGLAPELQQAAWTASLGTMKGHGVDTSSLSPTWDLEQAKQQLALTGPKPNLKAFNPGDVVIDQNAPIGSPPVLTVPAKTSFEQKTVTLDGKPNKLVNFNPQTGQSFLPGSTEPIEASRISGNPAASIQIQNMNGGGGATGPDLDASRPDPKTANKIDPRTGYTPNAIYQNALTFALRGTLPAMGNGSSPQVRAARGVIQNKAAAIAAQAGIDLPQLQAEYRANAGTLAKLLPQYTATATASNTAKDNLDLALEQSANVPRTGSPLANRYLQWANGHTLVGNPALTKLETYIYTAAREYAKVTSGGAASAQGLTDSAAKEAEKLINSAQSPEAFAAAIEAMQGDMGNVVGEQTKTIANVSSTIANFLSAANGGPPVDASPRPSAPARIRYDMNGNRIP